jgi:hypothetical protein
MTRKVAGAILVVSTGLACSACGTASTNDSAPAAATIKSAPRTVTLYVPVTRRVAKASGTGNKTIGTFAFRGKLSLGLSCTGKGNLDVEILASPSIPGLSTICPEIGVGLGKANGPGHGEHRVQIKIDAPARVHWTFTARETYPKPSIVPAGLQQLPIRRSGVGPESLGTFAVRGWLYIKATCVGTGKFGVWWNKSGGDRRCLNSKRKPTVKIGSNDPVYVHRETISVHAPAGMKWTVIVFNGPVDAGPNGLNVWR